MKKACDWFNNKGVSIILIGYALTLIIAVLEYFYIIPNLRIGGNNVIGILFISTSVLFVFSLVIFLPLYRLFGVKTIRTIRQGQHYPDRTYFPFFVNKKPIFSKNRTFMFTESCLYDFNDKDESDKNKLMGISFVIFPRIRSKSWLKEQTLPVLVWFTILGYVVIKPMHWRSARICWNTVNKENKIDIWPYFYDKGVRISGLSKMYTCELYIEYDFYVEVDKKENTVELSVKDTTHIGTEKHTINDIGSAYLYLDLYFGGNKPAPHTMIINELA